LKATAHEFSNVANGQGSIEALREQLENETMKGKEKTYREAREKNER